MGESIRKDLREQRAASGILKAGDCRFLICRAGNTGGRDKPC